MAIRVEELQLEPAVGARVYAFPTDVARGRTAARRRAARARRRAIARRRTALGATVVVIATMMLFAGGPAGVSTASSRHVPKAITIQSGQSLWSVAERYAPDGIDPRAYVDAVLALNHLSQPPPAGASLRLPR
jgi:Tfp pilus assembly protein FimV